MVADTRDRAREAEQAYRMRNLWAAVAITALSDAIEESGKGRNGCDIIRSWSRSRDGREVLSLAGIEPSERTTRLLVDFVRRGVRPTISLTRKAGQADE